MNQPAKQPFSDTIWDERETWSRDRIESFQLDALKRQLKRVGERSAHYQRVFAEAEATGWTTASWFTTPTQDLEDETPIAWISAGRDLETVLEAARAAAAPLRW